MQHFNVPKMGLFMMALSYPALLHIFYLGNAGELPVFMGIAAFILSLSAPLLGSYIAIREREYVRTQYDARRLLLPVAAGILPSLYCFVGVVCYMLNASTAVELTVFYFIVLAFIFWALMGDKQREHTPEVVSTSNWRFFHGGVAVLLLIFISAHLINHLLANFGGQLHLDVMDKLRVFYRHPIVEPALVILFVLQTLSGLLLVNKHLKKKGSAYNTLQIVTGLMLFVFLSSHLVAIFILGRWYAGIDTNWNWLVYPPGLLNSAWNVRLVTHYIAGVAALIIHLGLGARVVLIKHNMPVVARYVFWLSVVASIVLTVTIMTPLVMA